jgi:hypothetical protein
MFDCVSKVPFIVKMVPLEHGNLCQNLFTHSLVFGKSECSLIVVFTEESLKFGLVVFFPESYQLSLTCHGTEVNYHYFIVVRDDIGDVLELERIGDVIIFHIINI